MVTQTARIKQDGSINAGGLSGGTDTNTHPQEALLFSDATSFAASDSPSNAHPTETLLQSGGLTNVGLAAGDTNTHPSEALVITNV